jgi:hypothetical protein
MPPKKGALLNHLKWDESRPQRGLFAEMDIPRGHSVLDETETIMSVMVTSGAKQDNSQEILHAIGTAVRELCRPSTTDSTLKPYKPMRYEPGHLKEAMAYYAQNASSSKEEKAIAASHAMVSFSLSLSLFLSRARARFLSTLVRFFLCPV